MANGVYDWVERLPPGETVSFKDEEDVEKEEEPSKSPIAMQQPLVDMKLIRSRLYRKRSRSQVPIVDLTKPPDKKDTLEEGEITED